MNNIKNQNLQEFFFELCVISVKSEQIGQIGANLVKVGQKENFVKLFYIYVIASYMKLLE